MSREKGDTGDTGNTGNTGNKGDKGDSTEKEKHICTQWDAPNLLKGDARGI
jgi:hypothetical protein